MCCMRGLAYGFGHGRMRMNRANQFLDGRLEPQRHGGFGHQLGRC